MSRDILPFIAPDVSALAKTLGRDLASTEGRPGHVQLLNMLSRAVGYRNFQHFRAVAVAEGRLGSPAPQPDVIDYALVRRAMIDVGLIVRTLDGREYRRVERKPPGEALALIRRVEARSAA